MYRFKPCKTLKKFGFIAKSFVILTALFVFIFILCGCGKQKSSPIEDFTYEFEEGNVVITGYTGIDREIIIPEVIDERPVTVIGKKAFESYDLTSITIPETVTTIEINAFNNCNLLENINLNGELQHCSTESLQDSKWYENQKDGVVYLGCTAIGYKGSLPSEIIIEDGTKSIVDYAFEGYSSNANGYYNGDFSSIYIPESVNYIGKYAVGYYHHSQTGFNMSIDNFKINGKSGSIAETYANENSITFISEN